MTFDSALFFLLAIFIFGITPGPGVFAILARALQHGYRDCIALINGMIASDCVYLLFAMQGLAVIAEQWGEAFAVIRLVGGLYLLYLAYKMWTSPIQTVSSKPSASYKRSRQRNDFLQGVLISGSNPKVILFYIAFLPTFMDLTSMGANDMLLAVLLTFIGLFSGLLMIALAADHARRLFTSTVAQRRINWGAGTIMGLAGAYLLQGALAAFTASPSETST